MATVYFTNNADSGDGSLRAAINAANPGDIVTYDDTAFASVDTVTIALSTALILSKEVTIDGREKRIVLDGQGTILVTRLNTSVTLKQLDIVRGYHETANFAGVYAAAGTSTLEKCRLCGCSSAYSGSAAYITNAHLTFRDCLIAGNKTNLTAQASASIRTFTEGTATLVRCTAIGDTQRALSAATAGSITVQDSLIQGAHNVPGVTSITPSTAGFVAPCPDTIDPKSWTNTLWQSWDFRLTPESPYLTGAETASAENADLLGNPRQVGGALGAFEGSWLVVTSGEEKMLAADVRVDRLELHDGAALSFAGQDRRLSVVEGAVVGTATISGSGYLAVPSLTDVANATIAETVRVCEYSAGVLDVSATINEDLATIAVTKTQDKAVVVEGSNDGGVSWSPCVLVEDSTTLSSAKAYKFRVFDGEIFVETQVIARTYYYVSQLPEGDFAEPSDWSLDKAGTKVCTDAPTIADGTFDC